MLTRKIPTLNMSSIFSSNPSSCPSNICMQDKPGMSPKVFCFTFFPWDSCLSSRPESSSLSSSFIRFVLSDSLPASLFSWQRFRFWCRILCLLSNDFARDVFTNRMCCWKMCPHVSLFFLSSLKLFRNLCLRSFIIFLLRVKLSSGFSFRKRRLRYSLLGIQNTRQFPCSH